MDPNDERVAEVNSSLNDSDLKGIAYGAVVKYSTIVAGVPVDSPYVPAVGRRFLHVMEAAADGGWAVDDASLLADVEESVSAYLEEFDEEPDGWAYYPYMASLLILIALPLLVGGPGSTSVVSLWEYTRRYSAHVDWQLDRDGAEPGRFGPFRTREPEFWLSQVELAGQEGGVAAIGRSAAAFGREYVAALASVRR